MCHDPLHPFLEALPKCEQHMHLEGSLEPSLLFRLAEQNKISLPSPETDPSFTSIETLLDRYNRFTSLDDFLGYYFIGMSVLIQASDFEALAWEYFVRAKKDGVVHAEVFFDPQAHTSRGVAYQTVVEGFTSACKRAAKELEMTTLLIICFLRHLPVQNSVDMYETAREDLKAGVFAGIGLSSTEKNNPPKLWETIYANAKEDGFRRTAHAGEEGPVDYMRGAIEHLDVMRIDHGIKLRDDVELMKEIARKKILITMCPVSNLRLKCVKEIEELPVRTYLDYGVQFSVNSDDPAYFGAYILGCYCAVQEAFKLEKSDWAKIVTASIEGSWCGDDRKKEMLGLLDGVMKDFKD
jgi:adenosine deaminase